MPLQTLQPYFLLTPSQKPALFQGLAKDDSQQYGAPKRCSFCLQFFKWENGKSHHIFKLITYCSLHWDTIVISHQNISDLCVRERRYKLQHDLVNYSFNVDMGKFCRVFQQASNQATWNQFTPVTVLFWDLPYSINETFGQQKLMIYRTKQVKCRQSYYQYSIWYMHILIRFLPPPHYQYGKNSCISSSQNWNINLVFKHIGKEITVKPPVARQYVSHGSRPFHPERGCWRHH